MKILLTATLLSLTGVHAANAADDKITQAIEKGIVTGEALKKLTTEDIPSKWKAQKETKETDKSVTIVYSRDGVRRLEVTWSKDWKADKQKMFIATLYDGAKRRRVRDDGSNGTSAAISSQHLAFSTWQLAKCCCVLGYGIP